jgi:choline dehydrogenase-like flavoprotein
VRRLAADVVVVGSGAGGATVAGELARAGASVVVIEAGPLLGDPPGAHLRNACPSEDDLPSFGGLIEQTLSLHAFGAEPFGDAPGTLVVHAVGGALVHWTHHCPQPAPEEWPAAIPWSVAAQLLARAGALLDVDASMRDGGVRQARILDAVADTLGDLGPGRPVQPIPVAAGDAGGALRYAGADALLAVDHGIAPPLVVADHVARAVARHGDRATGVRAASLRDGDELQVAADAVVLAAGAIGTAQLLHASGIRPWALGRFATDHPMVGSRVALAAPLLDGVGFDDPEFGVWVPFAAHRRRHVQVVRAPIAPSELHVAVAERETADLFSFCAITPDPDNALHFDEHQRDGFGLPRAHLRMRLNAADVAEVAAAVGEQFVLAHRIGRVHEGWRPQLFPAGAAIHLMGTHRIGTSPSDSVADEAGRVWGHDDLYVAGNGVLSEYLACNPTLTTVACALRTADAVAGRPLASADQPARLV